MTTSDYVGCMAIVEGKLVSARVWDILEDSTPALVLLQQLQDKRWVAGKRTQPHKLDDEFKLYHAISLMKNKRYLRCVLSLDDLFAKGLPALHISELQSYYLVALSLGDLRGVLPGMGSVAYREMLKLGDGNCHAIAQLGDEENRQCLEDVSAVGGYDPHDDDDDDLPFRSLGDGAGNGNPEEKKKRKRDHATATQKENLDALRGTLWGQPTSSITTSIVPFSATGSSKKKKAASVEQPTVTRSSGASSSRGGAQMPASGASSSRDGAVAAGTLCV